MGKLAYLLVLSVILSSCASPPSRSVDDSINTEKVQNEVGKKDEVEKIAPPSSEPSFKDVPKFSVLNKESMLPYKASFDIRIFEKLDKDRLGQIGEHLQSKSGNANKVFVTFYLPGMKVGHGAWATAHSGESVNILDFMLDSNPTTLE